MEILVLLAIILFLLGPIGFFFTLGARDQIKELRRDFERVKSEVKRLRAYMGTLDSQGGFKGQSLSVDQEQEEGGKPHKVSESSRSHDSVEDTRDLEPALPSGKSAAPIEHSKDTISAGVNVVPDTGPEKIASHSDKASQDKASEREPVMDQVFSMMEDDFSTRWMIWLGGIALALGGVFLIKYSIDAGLLSPAVRLLLGSVLGIVFIGAGEMLRRGAVPSKWTDDTPDYLPTAFSAAGVFTLFAVVFSAHSLYGMLGVLETFIMLATLSVGTSFLGQLHGRFFAYLGLVAAMATPALVQSDTSNLWILFSYLLFVTTTSLFLARRNGWVDVAGLALFMGVAWSLVAFLEPGPIATVPLGLYLLVQSGLNSFFLRGATPAQSNNPLMSGIDPIHAVSKVTLAFNVAILVLLTILVRLDSNSVTSLGFFAIAMVGQAYAAFKNPEHDAGALSAFAASLFLLVTWHAPSIDQWVNPIHKFQNHTQFLVVAGSLAVLVGFGLFAALPKLLRKPMWASVGVAYPLITALIAYWRVSSFQVDLVFSSILLATAGLMMVAVKILRRSENEWGRAPTAAYAAGATMAVSFALAMVLRDAWLTTALAFQVVALAFIWQRLRVAGLRYFAMGIVVLVAARLLLNPFILDYGDDAPLPVVNWLFHAYALTAVLFAYAARLFKNEEDNLLSSLLTGASVLIATAFLTLEIRVLFGADGYLDGHLTAVEAAVQTVNWAVAATVLYWLELREGAQVFRFLRRVMTAISLIGLFFMGGLYNNIFFNVVDLGSWPILNLQTLQFLVPGLLYGLKAHMAKQAGHTLSHQIYGVVALAILFVWMTAEVRHGFHPMGGAERASDWEWYSYSAVWLAYAAALTFAGLRLVNIKLRMAGFAILGLVIGKVFLVDMSHLEGVARALSFMGLGGALLGLSYLYRIIRVRGARDIDEPV